MFRFAALLLAVGVLVLAGCAEAAAPTTAPSIAVSTVAPAPTASPGTPESPTPAPTATATPVPTPTPTATPNPLGAELRDRIVAFVPKVKKASARITRTVPPPGAGVNQIVPYYSTLERWGAVLRKERDWAGDVTGGHAGCEVAATCPLFGLWWTVAADAGWTPDCSLPEFDQYGRIGDRIGTALHPPSQRRLDRALAQLAALNKRVAKLAAVVEAAPDACAVSELP